MHKNKDFGILLLRPLRKFFKNLEKPKGLFSVPRPSGRQQSSSLLGGAVRRVSRVKEVLNNVGSC